MANMNQPVLNIHAFEDACGVGVIITSEMIETEVNKSITKVKTELLEKRYKFNAGLLMAEVRKNLKWADGKAVKCEIDVQIFDLLGQKTEADLAPPPKLEKKSGKDKVSKASKANEKKDTSVSNTNVNGNAEEEEGAATIAELMKTKVHFHKPGENYKTDGYVVEGK